MAQDQWTVGDLGSIMNPEQSMPAPTSPQVALALEQKKAAGNFIMKAVVGGMLTAAVIGGGAIWTLAGIKYFASRRKRR